jgi:hypothetical protein
MSIDAAAGRISAAHAQVIATVLRLLPACVDPDTRTVTEEQLLDLATRLDPDELRSFGRHLRNVLDPDGAEPRERDAVSQCTLSFTDRGDGIQRISGVLDDLTAAKFKARIDPLAAPRPAADGTLDPRSPGRRRADALLDLVEQGLRHGALPKARGARPHLVITADLATLLRLKGAPPATTASGHPRRARPALRPTTTRSTTTGGRQDSDRPKAGIPATRVDRRRPQAAPQHLLGQPRPTTVRIRRRPRLPAR